MLLTKNWNIIANPARNASTVVGRGRGLTGEAVNTRGDGALVGQISGDAAFVLGGGAADEGRVEDEAVLGRVAASLEGSVRDHSCFHTLEGLTCTYDCRDQRQLLTLTMCLTSFLVGNLFPSAHHLTILLSSITVLLCVVAQTLGCNGGEAGDHSRQDRRPSQVTLLCSGPALPSPQPQISPAGMGCPST